MEMLAVIQSCGFNISIDLATSIPLSCPKVFNQFVFN